MHVLIGVYSSLVMDLEPRGHDSSLRGKKQAFGANLVKFTGEIKLL